MGSRNGLSLIPRDLSTPEKTHYPRFSSRTDEVSSLKNPVKPTGSTGRGVGVGAGSTYKSYSDLKTNPEPLIPHRPDNVRDEKVPFVT